MGRNGPGPYCEARTPSFVRLGVITYSVGADTFCLMKKTLELDIFIIMNKSFKVKAGKISPLNK
jgi:hypothetical protein